MTRKTISLLTFFSFLLLILSSIALYVIPGGRGGTSEQLLLLGMNKMAWRNIHITGGFLFIAVALWHTILNCRALMAYLKKTAVLTWRSTTPLLAALAITLFVYAGTVVGLEPMQTVLTFTKPAKPAFSAQRANPSYGLQDNTRAR